MSATTQTSFESRNNQLSWPDSLRGAVSDTPKRNWIAEFAMSKDKIPPLAYDFERATTTALETARIGTVGGSVLRTAERDLEVRQLKLDNDAQREWVERSVADTLARAEESGPTIERRGNFQPSEESKQASAVTAAIRRVRDMELDGYIFSEN